MNQNNSSLILTLIIGGLLLVFFMKYGKGITKRTALLFHDYPLMMIANPILIFGILWSLETAFYCLPLLLLLWAHKLVYRPLLKKLLKTQDEQEEERDNVPSARYQQPKEPPTPEMLQFRADRQEMQRIWHEWSTAAYRSNMYIQDKDATRELAEIRREDRALGLIDGVAMFVTDTINERKFNQRQNTFVEGSTAYYVPRLLNHRYTNFGPAFLLEVIPGKTIEDYRKSSDLLASNLRVYGIRFTQTLEQVRQGVCEVIITLRDPLEKAVEYESVPAVKDMKNIPFALTETGEQYSLSFSNNSGLLVAGMPGSGKTGSMSSLFCRLIQSPSFQSVVIDGKGGSDWSWIEKRSTAYYSDPDLEELEEVLKRLENLRKTRMEYQKEQRGKSNFWSLPLVPEHPVVMLLIDECQTYFDPKEGLTKEDKAHMANITALVKKLVLKGRSAGIFVIAMTQKTTADAIPTSIRDNCGLALSFRVKNADAAEAVLGSDIRQSEVTPVKITANQPGIAVLDTDNGFTKVRVPYIEEENAERIAMQHKRHRKTLEQIEEVYAS